MRRERGAHRQNRSLDQPAPQGFCDLSWVVRYSIEHGILDVISDLIAEGAHAGETARRCVRNTTVASKGFSYGRVKPIGVLGHEQLRRVAKVQNALACEGLS